VLAPGVATTAPVEWTTAPPIDGVTDTARVIASPDGKTIFTVTPAGEGPLAKWIIRRARNGKFDHFGSVPAKGKLAGLPAFVNDTLLIPASDGFIYRLVLGDGRGVEDKLVGGPKWLLGRPEGQNPICFIVPLTVDTFLTSDGAKVLKRWNWPSTGSFADDNASWTLRNPIANAPLLIPAAAGKPARMLLADTTGGVWLYSLERSDAPLRSWIPGRTLVIPNGKVSDTFSSQTDAAGRQVVAYTVNDRKVVCLDIDSDEPRWVASTKDDAASSMVGSPTPMGNGIWLVTDLGGRVALLTPETGQAFLTREISLPGAVPQTAGVDFGNNRVLVPLSDGSAAIVPFEEAKKE
jgi:hypothetical protein